MKQHLNIIKLFISLVILSEISSACLCTTLCPTLSASMVIINASHLSTESSIKSYFDSNIKPLLSDIDDIQVEIAKSIVHIRTLEKEANIDEKKLLFLLQKNQDNFSLQRKGK